MSAPRVPLLVVDDEPPIRRLLRTSLGAQGYRILEAETGRGALELLARETPEVMLLDLGLPDLDGLEVIRRVRASGANVAVVVLSAAATSAARSRRSTSARTTT
jgi:two-component system KDP operon response regulator KdpE